MRTWNAATIAAPYAAMTSPLGESFFSVIHCLHSMRANFIRRSDVHELSLECGK
jgi:hypothetical protein